MHVDRKYFFRGFLSLKFDNVSVFLRRQTNTNFSNMNYFLVDFYSKSAKLKKAAFNIKNI